jgi:hypothetical protein
VNGIYGERWWNDNLRMSRQTFESLCTELRPYLQRNDTNFRLAVTVEARVAVTIWRLATNSKYRTIAELFGLGRSTVGEIVMDTCGIIAKHFFNRYVYMPQGDRLRQIVDGFERRWGFPQVVGAIDGTHIPIIKPDDSPSDYFNRKGFYSIIMQAVVDNNGLFLDAYIGWPGKVHDARVLVNSTLYKKAITNNLLPNCTRRLCGVDIPLLILGDPAYPLLPWLMKPYLENQHSTSEERHFNYRQSRARMTVENAFGRLKGRWRCLLKRMDVNIANIPNVVATCVALHNYCEMHGDECQPEWIYRDSQRDNEISSFQQQTTSTYIYRGTGSAIRNALTQYLNN